LDAGIKRLPDGSVFFGIIVASSVQNEKDNPSMMDDSEAICTVSDEGSGRDCHNEEFLNEQQHVDNCKPVCQNSPTLPVTLEQPFTGTVDTPKQSSSLNELAEEHQDQDPHPVGGDLALGQKHDDALGPASIVSADPETAADVDTPALAAIPAFESASSSVVPEAAVAIDVTQQNSPLVKSEDHAHLDSGRNLEGPALNEFEDTNAQAASSTFLTSASSSLATRQPRSCRITSPASTTAAPASRHKPHKSCSDPHAPAHKVGALSSEPDVLYIRTATAPVVECFNPVFHFQRKVQQQLPSLQISRDSCTAQRAHHSCLQQVCCPASCWRRKRGSYRPEARSCVYAASIVHQL
jgi:hypothetical protein